MDQSRRQITKIAREVSKFTVREMKKEARAGFPEVSARLETGAGQDE